MHLPRLLDEHEYRFVYFLHAEQQINMLWVEIYSKLNGFDFELMYEYTHIKVFGENSANWRLAT